MMLMMLMMQMMNRYFFKRLRVVIMLEVSILITSSASGVADVASAPSGADYMGCYYSL
jgi:hypothetical protein